MFLKCTVLIVHLICSEPGEPETSIFISVSSHSQNKKNQEIFFLVLAALYSRSYNNK